MIFFSLTQELQSARGADPQPEYYIDQISQMTSVSCYTLPKAGWYEVWESVCAY